jgi:hypothetical protein
MSTHRLGLAVTLACACALGCSGDRQGTRGAGRDSTGTHTGHSTPGSPSTQAAGAGGDGFDSVAPGASNTSGASGASGASGSDAAPVAGDGGTVAKPNPALDPNATFDWPETPPGGGSCEDGTYTGTFDCTFSDPSGFVPDVELTGPVSLTFMKSKDGEFLEITEGDFEAIANDVIGARAKISGKLDCGTWMLAAMAVDGAWSIGDPNDPLIPGGALTGDITGTLDPMTGTLSGQWNFGDPAIGACPGTWSVMHTP